MSTDNFGALGADFFIKTFDKGSVMSQSDLDALVQYIQLTTTILAIGEFTPDEQESVWMILERVDVATVPDYTVTNNTDVTMTSGGLVTINSMPWSKITNKPTIPSLDGYATESWVNSQGFISSVDTGNFTFTNNNITTDNGQSIVLSIQGYDNTYTPPYFNNQSWTFGFDGYLTTVGLALEHAQITAEEGENIFDANVGKNLRIRTHLTPSAAPWVNDWIFDTDGTLRVPGTITMNERLTLNSLGAESGYTAAVLADGNLGRVFVRTLGGTDATLQTWEFNKEGQLMLPAGGDIVDSAGNSVLGGGSGLTNEITNTDPEGPTYSVSVGTDGVVTMVTSRGNLEFGALPEPGAPTHFHIMRPAGQEGGSDLYFGDDYNYVKLPSSSYSQQGVEIGSSLNQGTVSVWRFGTDGDLVLPAGKTIRDTDGVDLLNEPTTPQYGYFNELAHTGDNNRINGEAVAMDSDGNSYVSYTYYDQSESKDFGGVMKFDSTGAKLWSVNIESQNSNARNVEIVSLKYTTVDGDPALIALGSYYDNNASKDVAFMCYINPVTGSVGEPLVDAELNSANGMELKDGVVGTDSNNNPFAVVVGSTYDQTVQKTLTPLAGSTVDKVIFSWSDINASGLGNAQQLYLNENGNYYSLTINNFDTSATVAGSTEPSWTGISLAISTTQSGSYVITRVNGWGSAQYSWNVPQTLTILGSTLGGVDGVNDMTFDFDRDVFANNSSNIDAAVSNIQGTPASSGVVCNANGGRDWANDVGNPISFSYQLNNQAYIARFGTTSSWTKTIGASSYDRLNSVVVDSNGNAYAVGYVGGAGNKSSLVIKYDINGTQQWAVYIDRSGYTGNDVESIDLLNDGNLIAVDEDGVVTKLSSSDGSIIWQVQADTGPSWNGDFKGTSTPDGDYIIVNYEDNDYTMYVMKVSGSDGSSLWNKRIARTYNGNNGEVYAQDDFDAQYIDCNTSYLTIAGTSDPYSGNTVGLVFSFPISGENTDGTYGQYVISSESMDWNIQSTTSTSATITDSLMSVTANPTSPTSTSSNITVTRTMIGGGEETAFVSLATLKQVVADSTDFADFQTRIANM